MTESTIMSDTLIVIEKPKRKRASSIGAKKPPGRPPTVGQRQHLFLPGNVRKALLYCSTAMDAVGPSEVIRVSLMHCRNCMLADKKDVDIVAQATDKDISLCSRLDEGDPLSDAPMSTNPKMHITMTPSTSSLLAKVAETSGLHSPSATVSLAILMFGDYMEAVKRGECVVFTDDQGVIAGYSPWLSESEVRAICRAS